MTLNIKTLIISTFSILDLIVTLSISIDSRYAEFNYADCRIFLFVMGNVVMLRVATLNVVMLCVVAP